LCLCCFCHEGSFFTITLISRFVTPAAPQELEEKVDGPAINNGPSYSEIKPTVDMDTVAYATLGMGAVGTVLYGIYAASADEKKRRSSLYKRSVDDQRRRAADMLWASLHKHSLQGKRITLLYLLNDENASSQSYATHLKSSCDRVNSLISFLELMYLNHRHLLIINVIKHDMFENKSQDSKFSKNYFLFSTNAVY
jgi:hypothetical protein